MGIWDSPNTGNNRVLKTKLKAAAGNMHQHQRLVSLLDIIPKEERVGDVEWGSAVYYVNAVMLVDDG